MADEQASEWDKLLEIWLDDKPDSESRTKAQLDELNHDQLLEILMQRFSDELESYDRDEAIQLLYDWAKDGHIGWVEWTEQELRDEIWEQLKEEE